MGSIKSEAVLWYNVEQFGAAGYAVPNWGLVHSTLNQTILDLVDSMGRNLFAFMHHDDADMRTPPSINSIIRIHKLCLRARQILAGRAVGPAVPLMETAHADPAPEQFRVYPLPFFKVRNRWLKTYAGLVLTALTEAMQHTENRRPFDVSFDFAGLIGQYLTRIYQMVAIELLLVDPVAAKADGFVISDKQLQAYNPALVFTSTELVDNVPPFTAIFTAAQLYTLEQGILIQDLPEMGPYPSGRTLYSGMGGGDAAGNATSTGIESKAAADTSPAASIPAFPARPTP